MTVSIVIPQYNEERILEKTISRLAALSFPGYEIKEILFSDDGSRDKSREIVLDAGKKDERIKLLPADRNYGKGNAVRRGMIAATGEIVIFTDCDLAYGTDVFPTFFNAIRNGADVAAGSRAHKEGMRGYSFLRRVLSVGYRTFLHLFGGLPVRDSQSGIKAFSRDAAHEIFPVCIADGFSFDYEVLLVAKKKGFSAVEVPVVIIENTPSSMHFFRDSFRMVKDILRIKKHHRHSVMSFTDKAR